MKIKGYLSRLIVLLLVVFIALSIGGAFMGAERAQVFFNSVPLVVFWGLLFLTLLIGFFVYVSLRKRLLLTLIHAGCVLVLAGGMLGSEAGNQVYQRITGQPSFTKGWMSLHRGLSSNRVTSETDAAVGELPFEVWLKDAYVEYYDSPAIGLHFDDGLQLTLSAQVGAEIEIPDGRGTVGVAAAYRNFKMKQVDGHMVSYDSTEPGYNPAYQLSFTPAGGQAKTSFVFEQFPMHARPGQTYHAEYIAPQRVKDYKSVLHIVEGGNVAKQATIEVNKPLFYGGYHFYQNTFGYEASGPVSGIMVASARGVLMVFAGYAFIFVGVMMHLWPKAFRNNSRGQDGGRNSNGH